jgi:hypothetical protein
MTKEKISNDYMRGISEMYKAKPNADNNKNRL